MSTYTKCIISFIILILTSLILAEDKVLDQWLPNEGAGVVKHMYYDVKFNPASKTPEWVMYRMGSANRMHVASRDGKRFVPDPQIKQSVRTATYNKTGFDRGHMVPADDMEFTDAALQETFYTSNITPQAPGFNRGIWKEVENQVRAWAKEGRKMVIIAGTVFTNGEVRHFMGKDSVGIPDGFYKIVYDYKHNEMVAFLFMFNDGSHNDDTIEDYVIPVSELESRINIDFFKGIKDEDRIESVIGLGMHK